MRRRRLRTAPKPGLGEAYWHAQKERSEARMRGHDELDATGRDLVGATNSLLDAAYLYATGIRSFEEAERAVARGLPKRRPVVAGPALVVPGAGDLVIPAEPEPEIRLTRRRRNPLAERLSP